MSDIKAGWGACARSGLSQAKTPSIDLGLSNTLWAPGGGGGGKFSNERLQGLWVSSSRRSHLDKGIRCNRTCWCCREHPGSYERFKQMFLISFSLPPPPTSLCLLSWIGWLVLKQFNPCLQSKAERNHYYCVSLALIALLFLAESAFFPRRSFILQL